MRLGQHADFSAMLVAAAALCALITGCSLIVATPSSYPIVVTDSDSGKSIALAPGAELEVSLKATSGTGYLWQIAGNDPAVLKPRGLGNFEVPKDAAPGAMAKQVFHFDAQAPGSAKLEMVYVRPWEKNVAPVRTWSITVSVQS
ncbi:MAG: protease inhibitor I42 family protein [Candidatus Binataceae bacterium]